MSLTIVQVAIPVPLRQLFSYQLPESIDIGQEAIGRRVLVPFSGRQVIGVIVQLTKDTHIDADKLKSIISIPEDEFPLPASIVNLISLVANYYHHPIGEVYHLALPAALRKIDREVIPPTERWRTYSEQPQLAIEKIASGAPKQFQLYQAIAEQPNLTWLELRQLGFEKAQLTALHNKRLIEPYLPDNTPYSWGASHINHSNKHKLSTEQAIVVTAVTQQLASFNCHLVDGVTGSGKTEVYLQAIEAVIEKEQQVLVLVPEIGLTPQMLSRFENRFDVPIYLNHSGLNEKERLQTWQAAHQGKAAIVIGTRSAVFMPLQRLGLIIIDEEHDASFKQQDTLRYHARDVAIMRAKQIDIPIVLGSATPSFESIHNATTGKFRYHRLTKRAGNSVEAKLDLIDTTNQTLESGISPTLRRSIEQTLAKHEQVLIFLNRRGYAPAINCQECNWLAECSRCNSTYTLHQKQGLLICHHCNSQKRIPTQCANCGSIRIKAQGVGTEQLEQYLSTTFPQYSSVRIDRDSTRKKGELAKLLNQVANKEHQILIGTQMLAKGHHFPDVTLVAILDVDGALFSYDYRASEYMAQLLVQVAGRAGRASKPGRVLVQTRYPEHPLLQDLKHNGYRHFSTLALEERRLAQLPPYSFQVLVRAEANYPSYPEKFLRELSQAPIAQGKFAGPLPTVMEKKAGKYRFHLILQSPTRQALHHNIRQLLNYATEISIANKVRWTIDVDPTDLTW